jgi:hypothetical protein
MKALILKNTVVQIELEEFPVAQPMTWVECANDVDVGWIYDGESFSAPTSESKTLEDLKSLKRTYINQSRDLEETGGFEYLGKILDSDERSSLRITMAAMTARLSLDAEQPFSIDWTTKDNSILTLDVYQTLEMPKALAIHGLTGHGKAKYLKGLVDNATSPEELESIIW